MITNSELIEKYFDKSLSEDERVLFKQKYDTDSDFKEEFEQQAEIIFALKLAKTEKAFAPKSGLYAKILPFLMGVAAAAVILMAVVLSVFNHKIKEKDNQIAKLQKVKPVTIISSEDSVQNILREYHLKLVVLRDSLNILSKGVTKPIASSTNGVITEKNRAKLFAMCTRQEKQTKVTDKPIPFMRPSSLNSMIYYLYDLDGDRMLQITVPYDNSDSSIALKSSGRDDYFQIIAPDRKMPVDPAHVTIRWTPIHEIGDLNLYLINDQNDKIPVEKLSYYDLRLGQYDLTGLEQNSLYVFEIIRDGRFYRFPFDTK